MINESTFENQLITWLQDSGWEYRYGPDIAPEGDHAERSSYGEVLLVERVRKALTHLNPGFPAAALDEALDILLKPQHPSAIANNRAFHEYLINGIPATVEIDGEKRGDRVKLIDFEAVDHNQFLVVNQFTVTGLKQRRVDMVAFINGLPLVVIELKNAVSEEADIWSAFNQLQAYKQDLPDLFVYNEALVISDGVNARVGSLTADRERFTPWRTLKSEKDKPRLELELETLARGFFNRELLLDYLRNFVVFEDSEDGPVKKIAGYHQFHAVREAVRATIAASRSEGDRRGGVVWHTQGSGKSITMSCFAGKLVQQPEMQNPTLVMVTDRNDLDGQLYQTFCNTKMLLKQDPVQVEDRGQLRELLEGRPAGGVIFTTIQKFMPDEGETRFPQLSERTNIVVIADEAHRSQYGFRAKLDEETGEFQYGYAQHLRDALPNATFIGFTGTPIERDDRSTHAVFGEYVSVYDIRDAVDDGATVPIYYESRLAKLNLKADQIPQIDEDVEEVIEDQEDIFTREKTKGKWAALAKLVGAAARVQQVAADVVQHFENRRAALHDAKGMIVCMSREICVRMYNEIIALRPEWHNDDPKQGAIKIVMTGSAADTDLFKPHIYSKKTKRDIASRFKSPKDPLKLVIVRDMWLTGFDVPCLHTMYIDKPMKGHNLMQAIARVNRVFRDKQGGLVVDYLGIAGELRYALKVYVDSQGKGKPAIEASEPLAELQKHLDAVRGMFHDFDYSEYLTKAHHLLVPASNYILNLENGKKRYFDEVLAVTRAFSLCGTLDEALALREEIAFFQAVRAVIAKASSSDKKLTEEQKHSALKIILDNAVVAEGLQDIFALAGLHKPDISLLSDAFLDELAQLPERNFAVELLQKLLNDQIKSRLCNNVVLEKKFSDRLLETLRRYQNRAIETAQVIEELIAMAKDFRSAATRGEQLGLNDDEVAFYDALANNESAVRELGDDILKKIAQEITEKLRHSTTVDWQERESVRARLRNMVRVTLRRYKYPPDHQQEAIELVIKQAERLSEEWSEIGSQMN